MFLDEVKMYVEAGNGGNGCCAFLREKYRPHGGPSGGNGGRGGNVVFIGDEGLHTLQDLAYQRHNRAKRGAHGSGDKKNGRRGEDLVLKVPLGTMVYNEQDGNLLADITEHRQEVVIAQGGRGGLGNAALVSRNNPLPDYAHEGKPGERFDLLLNLKVLADVGLVGLPNAGKSTFLSSVSKARPKIADYPFTTLQPNLGIVAVPGAYQKLVIADIPGLIEHAHTGKGLGIQFLKHIERTRVIAYCIDVNEPEPQKQLDVLKNELQQYSLQLTEKPSMVLLTKTDSQPDASCPQGWYPISSVAHLGLQEVIIKMAQLCREEPC